jgi:hypothetical protein
MSDRALLFVLGYMAFSFGAGVFVGKAIKWGQRSTCSHEWEERGYGGAGWSLVRCSRCGMTEIRP